MIWIFIGFFDSAKSFDGQDIQSQISQSRPYSKIFEDSRIITILQWSQIRSYDFDSQKAEQSTDNSTYQLPCCIFND
jgi:hypothetical protein